jgi:hypothetical protein
LRVNIFVKMGKSMSISTCNMNSKSIKGNQ